MIGTTGVCPHRALFDPVDRPADEPDPHRATLRAAGPVVRVTAPAGGPAWVVTEEVLARAVLADPRIVKDPAWAPAAWDRRQAGLEPTAAEATSLTTLDGAAHTALRRAHAPLFTPRRMREYAPRARDLAAGLLAREAAAAGPDGQVDLVGDFAARLPATVVLDVLGVPLEHVDVVVRATHDFLHGHLDGDTDRVGPALGAFLDAAAAGLSDGSARTRADELRDRMPEGTTRVDLLYALFGVIFAGQLTTEAVLGDALLAALTDGAELDDAAVVERSLRRYAPLALSLWRFTTTDVELAGHRLPARSPVLVDLRGLGEHDADLAFGAGPHHCAGAALARVELIAAVRALRDGFPAARLAPGTALRRVGPGGSAGDRLAALPVLLRG